MSEEEKMAKLELNRYIYGKQLSKDDIADYLGILFNLIDNQQKEIEEKTTILLAGAEKVKQLEKEIQRLEKDNDTLSELVIVNEDKVIKELDLISKDKIREKIKAFQDVKKEIIKNENKLLKASITYDIVRNDYCEKMLQELLEEKYKWVKKKKKQLNVLNF